MHRNYAFQFCAAAMALLAATTAAGANDMTDAIKKAGVPGLKVYEPPRSGEGIGYVYAIVNGKASPVCDNILPKTASPLTQSVVPSDVSESKKMDVNAGFSLLNGILSGLASLGLDFTDHNYKTVSVKFSNFQRYDIYLSDLAASINNGQNVAVSDTCRTSIFKQYDAAAKKLKAPMYFISAATAATGFEYHFSQNKPNGPETRNAGQADRGATPAAGRDGAAATGTGRGANAAATANNARGSTGSAPADAVKVAEDALKTITGNQDAKPSTSGNNAPCDGTGFNANATVTEVGDIHLKFCFLSTATVDASGGNGRMWIQYEVMPLSVAAIATVPSPTALVGGKFTQSKPVPAIFADKKAKVPQIAYDVLKR